MTLVPITKLRGFGREGMVRCLRKPKQINVHGSGCLGSHRMGESSLMYGDLALKLVNQAKRTRALNHLPPCQPEVVGTVVQEVRDLDADATAILAPFGGSFDPHANPAAACSLLVDHLCMRRNKRCLLAYHRVRLDKLEEMCWSGRDILRESVGSANGRRPDGTGQPKGEVANALSPEEEEHVRQYEELLATHKSKWTDIDLTGSLEPPKDLYVDVRVLKDAGEIQTEYGAITLTKNSVFYARLVDVERLIAQGYLEQLK